MFLDGYFKRHVDGVAEGRVFSVLQRVAACCSVLQCVAVCCSVSRTLTLMPLDCYFRRRHVDSISEGLVFILLQHVAVCVIVDCSASRTQ